MSKKPTFAALIFITLIIITQCPIYLRPNPFQKDIPIK
jgi:hypothetical protein